MEAASIKNRVLTKNLFFEWRLLSPPSSTVKIIGAHINEATKKLPLWGQVNRFAPAKTVLRILGNRLDEIRQSRIELKKFSSFIANSGPLIRAKLEEAERRGELRRGELLSVGFPKQEPNSQQRFITQYVGRLRAIDSRVEGIQGDLAFVDIKEESDGSVMIGITDQGLRFARLESPMIDEAILQNQAVTNPFCDEEVTFLIDHIREVRPGEFDFLSFVMQAIASGSDSPALVKGDVQRFLKQKHEANVKIANEITESVIKTMAAGATSKLTELGCIKITRTGRKSTYSVSGRSKLLSGS